MNGSSSYPNGAQDEGIIPEAHSVHPMDSAHAVDTVAHLYSTGFSQSLFADCMLHVVSVDGGRSIYALHRLLLARSPTLRHCITTQADADFIELHLSDSNITQDALVTAIGYLYSSQALRRIRSTDLRAMLAAATFLHIPDLASYVADLCRDQLANLTHPTEIADWLAFLDTSVAAIHDGAPMSQPSTSKREPLYGAAATQLRAQLLLHITQNLPQQYNAFSTTVLPIATNGVILPNAPTPGVASQEGQDALVRIYASLPFSVFKDIIESANFPPGDMERFSFAKRCIAERKRTQPQTAVGENAVLAFAGNVNGSSNVSVISKATKSRKLWKIGD